MAATGNQLNDQENQENQVNQCGNMMMAQYNPSSEITIQWAKNVCGNKDFINQEFVDAFEQYICGNMMMAHYNPSSEITIQWAKNVCGDKDFINQEFVDAFEQYIDANNSAALNLTQNVSASGWVFGCGSRSRGTRRSIWCMGRILVDQETDNDVDEIHEQEDERILVDQETGNGDDEINKKKKERILSDQETDNDVDEIHEKEDGRILVDQKTDNGNNEITEKERFQIRKQRDTYAHSIASDIQPWFNDQEILFNVNSNSNIQDHLILIICIIAGVILSRNIYQ